MGCGDSSPTPARAQPPRGTHTGHVHCSPGTLGSWGFGGQPSQGWEETASQARNHTAQVLTSTVDPWIEGQQLVRESSSGTGPLRPSAASPARAPRAFLTSRPGSIQKRDSLWLNLHDLQSSLQRVSFFSWEETISPCIPKGPLSPMEPWPPGVVGGYAEAAGRPRPCPLPYPGSRWRKQHLQVSWEAPASAVTGTGRLRPPDQTTAPALSLEQTRK